MALSVFTIIVCGLFSPLSMVLSIPALFLSLQVSPCTCTSMVLYNMAIHIHVHVCTVWPHRSLLLHTYMIHVHKILWVSASIHTPPYIMHAWGSDSWPCTVITGEQAWLISISMLPHCKVYSGPILTGLSGSHARKEEGHGTWYCLCDWIFRVLCCYD